MILSVVALCVVGIASAAMAQGTVSGTYWMPSTWKLELKADAETYAITIPGRGLSVSGDFAFAEKFGVSFAYSSIFSTGNLTISGPGGSVEWNKSKASGSYTMIDAAYKLYSDPVFSISPAVGYFMASSAIEGELVAEADAPTKMSFDASGFKVGAKGTAVLMEGLEGYVSGGYVPSLTLKPTIDGTAYPEEQGTAVEFNGGVRYAVKVVPNLYVDGGYKYVSVTSKDEANNTSTLTTSGIYLGASYRF